MIRKNKVSAANVETPVAISLMNLEISYRFGNYWINCLAELLCKKSCWSFRDRLCGLVVRVLGYRSGGPGSIPGTTKKQVVDLERGPLSLVSTTEELLD
jgi:hypothetical protein